MATTIISSPQLYTFTGNPLMWVFSSSQTAQPNFSFIVEVVLNGVVIGTHEVFIENLSSAKIDVQTIVDSYVSYLEQTIDETTIAVAQTLPTLLLNIKEKYGTTPIIQSTLATSTIYLMKGSLELQEFYNWDYNDYTIASDKKKFLTANPLLTDFGTFGIIFDYPAGALIYRLYVTDSNGILKITTPPLGRLMFFNINNATLTAMGYTIAQIAASTLYTYQVYSTSVADFVSEKRTINLLKCSNFTNTLTYINRYSIPEQFVFRQHERYKYKTDASTFEKRIGGWVGSDYILNPLNSGLQPIETTRDGSVELFSEILPNELASYLLTEINTTPYAVLNGQMVFVPTDSFETRNVNDDPTQISIKGKLANGYKSNRV